jgi:hypothetical protein
MKERLRLECRPFEQLEDCVRHESCVPDGSSAATCDQVKYLSSYLQHEDVGARTILVEHEYVDRHWLEEYSNYYSTLLSPPRVKATRLHFFDVAWTLEEFKRLLSESMEAPGDSTLNGHYLGFAVIRPLPGAPIGRTVLRPYRKNTDRCFAPAELVHRVHLAGLTLELEGLPFQQQDQGVAACATTALWSALTKVIRTDGGRAPTPFAVTKAAIDRKVQARAFPATAGLDLDQTASAVQAFDYQPHVFQSADDPDAFFLALKIYLRSGIPVVVRAKVEDGDLHALTLVGFREVAGDAAAPGQMLQIGKPDRPRLSARGIKQWYAHDDRLGPYARLGFDADGFKLKLLPSSGGFPHLQSPMSFWEAIVPLYPKLRLTAEELIEFGVDLAPTIAFLAKAAPGQLSVEPFFVLGGEYIRRLRSRPLARERVVRLCMSLTLSRYVGVISWFLAGEWIVDVVYDTTDLRRSDSSRPPALALIPRNSTWCPQLEKLRELRFGEGPLIG